MPRNELLLLVSNVADSRGDHLAIDRFETVEAIAPGSLRSAVADARRVWIARQESASRYQGVMLDLPEEDGTRRTLAELTFHPTSGDLALFKAWDRVLRGQLTGPTWVVNVRTGAQQRTTELYSASIQPLVARGTQLVQRAVPNLRWTLSN